MKSDNMRKLDKLRADVLRLSTRRAGESLSIPNHDPSAAINYVTAQAKYTLAVAKVKDDSILDYVELDK